MASKNAKQALAKIAKNGAKLGATEGERLAAQNVLARVSQVSPVKFTAEFKVRRHRGDTSQLITHEAVQFFLKKIKGGETISYRDLISPTFVNQDFYVMVDILTSLGLATKEGSRYHIEKSYKQTFSNWYNQQISSLML
jgi:hypothetical protein